MKGVPMPHFKKLTPNLVVANVERSLAFYVDTLGFERGLTVPEDSPLVFASVTSGPIEIFFNDTAAAVKEYPGFDGKPIGATGTLKPSVKVVMPIVTQFYGMREFAIEDPDGYVITFAERVETSIAGVMGTLAERT